MDEIDQSSIPSQPENMPAVVSGGVDIDSQGDSNIHGDVVGRDKIVNVSVQVSPVEPLARASNPEPSAASNHLELDRHLFLKIREILPSQSMIDVRECDYGGAFPREMHKDLHNFVYFCKTPECEFIDADMERLRAALYESINQFLRKIGVYTFPEHMDPMWNRIPRDPYGDLESIQILTPMAKDEEDFNKRMKEQSERVIRYAQELNDSATESWKAFEEFIRQGRRRLAV
jgi:hypothetical protein